MSHVAARIDSFLGPQGRIDVNASYAPSRLSCASKNQYMYAIASPGDRPMPAVQCKYTVSPRLAAASSAAAAAGKPSRNESAEKSTNGYRSSFIPRFSICRFTDAKSTFQYSISLSCCVLNTHVTPSTSRSRSISAAVVGCVPTMRFGRIL